MTPLEPAYRDFNAQAPYSKAPKYTGRETEVAPPIALSP